MLVQFTFDNYKCFKDDTTLNLVCAKSAKQHYTIQTKYNYSVLRTLAVYGPNASGKTKLFDALAFMRSVVCPPKRDEKIPVFDFWQTKYDAFRLNTYSVNQESYFEVVFILDGTQFRYGFSLNKDEIFEEWLYKKDKRETLVFSRDKVSISMKANHINDSIYRAVSNADMISPVVPLISILATFSEPLCKSIVSWFENVTIISANDLKPVHLLDDNKKESIISFMRAFDINIENLVPHEIEFNSIPDKVKLLIGDKHSDSKFFDGFQTLHKVYDENYDRVDFIKFSLENDESFGTNRLLGIAWPVINSLKKGSLLLIDEFDSGIHPFIVSMIISLYYMSHSTAQLVINTHNTSLLSAKDDDGQKLFGKEQIYVINKNRYGESKLLPITDFDNDFRANLERMYLSGDISGLPYINIDDLKKALQSD